MEAAAFVTGTAGTLVAAVRASKASEPRERLARAKRRGELVQRVPRFAKATADTPKLQRRRAEGRSPSDD